jgi:hypothetical protein
VDDAAASAIGALVGVGGQLAGDAIGGHLSDWQTYTAAGVGGAASGEAALYTGGLLSGAAYGAAFDATDQELHMHSEGGAAKQFDWAELGESTAAGALFGRLSELAGLSTPFRQSINGDMITVSRWGRGGLKEGDWVMKGGKNVINYILSFKWEPSPWNKMALPDSGQEFQVPASSVKWPTAPWWESYKGLLGQWQYRP